MKILNIFKPQIKPKKFNPVSPVIYDRNNVTANEFKQYVRYLSENRINRSFREPDKFVTEDERKQQQLKEKKLKEYRDFVHYLAEHNINRTFLQ